MGLSMDYLWTVEKNGFVLKKTCFQILWISVRGSFLIHRPYGIEDLPSLGVISWSMVYQYPKISRYPQLSGLCFSHFFRNYPAVPMWQSQWEIKPPVGDGHHDLRECSIIWDTDGYCTNYCTNWESKYHVPNSSERKAT
jgi:hypothetical protein